MPLSSSDISLLLQNQQAMFGNSEAYARQIAMQNGTLPPGPAAPTYTPVSLSDPRGYAPGMDVSAALAGASAGTTALGVGLAGAGLLGSVAEFGAWTGPHGSSFGASMLTGGGRGLLSPMLTVGRAATQGFWGGAGITGAMEAIENPGLFSTMGHVGRGMLGGTFSGGRLAAGLAGGLGAGLLAAAPYAAIGAAVDFAGSNMMQGAQQYSSTANLLASIQRSQMPMMAGPGAQGFSPSDASGITSMLRNAATSTGMDFGSTQGLMAGMVGSGAMSSVQSAYEFQTKFRELLSAVQQVSEIFHTTLQEALPVLQQHKQMGVYSTGDILSTMQANRSSAIAAGISSGGMSDMMVSGAQIGRMAGTTGARGMRTMRGIVEQVGAARTLGMISEEALSEATGGLLGEDAVASLSQSTLAAGYGALQGRSGYMTLGALMNRSGTGLDQGLVSRYAEGDISQREIAKLFHQNTRTREGRMALRAHKSSLGGELMEEVGPLGVIAGQMRSRVGDRLDRETDENVLQMIEEQYSGLSQQQYQLVKDLMRKGGAVHMEVQQRAAMARFSQRQVQAAGSWQSIKKRLVDATWGKAERLFQETGQEVSEWSSEVSEGMLDTLTGSHSYQVTPNRSRFVADMQQGSFGQFASLPTTTGGGRTQGRSSLLPLLGGAAGALWLPNLPAAAAIGAAGWHGGDALSNYGAAADFRAISSSFGGEANMQQALSGPSSAWWRMSADEQSRVFSELGRVAPMIGGRDIGMAPTDGSGDMGERLRRFQAAAGRESSVLGKLSLQDFVYAGEASGALKGNRYAPDTEEGRKWGGYGRSLGGMSAADVKGDIWSFTQALTGQRPSSGTGVAGALTRAGGKMFGWLSEGSADTAKISDLLRGDAGASIVRAMYKQDTDLFRKMEAAKDAESMGRVLNSTVQDDDVAALQRLGGSVLKQGFGTVRRMLDEHPGVRSGIVQHRFDQQRQLWEDSQLSGVQGGYGGTQMGQALLQSLRGASTDIDAFERTNPAALVDKLIEQGANKAFFAAVNEDPSSMGVGVRGWNQLSAQEGLGMKGGKFHYGDKRSRGGSRIDSAEFRRQMNYLLPGANKEIIEAAYKGTDIKRVQEALEAAHPGMGDKLARSAVGGFDAGEVKDTARGLSAIGQGAPATGAGRTGPATLSAAFQQAQKWTEMMQEGMTTMARKIEELK